MSEIEPLDPKRDTGITISVGSTKLTLREFQDLYAELGNGGDTLSREFGKPFIVEIDDLKSLYQKLSHLISNFGPIAVQEKITITHFEDDRQEFDSFEKFLGYDKNKGSPVSSVNLEITFALKSPLPPHHKVREYEIDIYLRSSVVDVKKMQGRPAEETEFLRLTRPPFTGGVRVHYFDYSVAVSCMSIVAGWMNSLREGDEISCYKFLRKFQNPIQVLVHFAIIGTMCGFSAVILPPLVGLEASALLVAMAGLLAVAFAGSRIAFWLAARLRASTHMLSAHSLISLGVGDQRLATWYERERRRSVAQQIYTLGGTLASSLVVGVLVRLLLPR